MTNDEIDLTLDFLEILTDYQASAGCNDFWFPKNWTEEQKNKILNELKEEQIASGEIEEDEDPYISDSIITYYLMYKLRKMKQ